MKENTDSQKEEDGLGIPEGLCARCGFEAEHPSPEDCITALRDLIADLEEGPLKLSKRRKRRTPKNGSEKSGTDLNLH